MDTNSREQLEELFQTALAVGEDEHERMINSVVKDDPQLGAELKSLINHNEKAEKLRFLGDGPRDHE